MWPFKPIWMSKDFKTWQQRDRALKKVEKLPQDKLVQAALEAPDWRIREEAIARLTDPMILAKAAESDSIVNNRLVAVERIMDQAVLVRIAGNDTDHMVRIEAIGKVTDQEALARIAENDTNQDVCKAALKRVSDPMLLVRIAANAEDTVVRSVVRCAAVERVSDPLQLAHIAENNADSLARGTAVKRISDQALLARIAVHDADSWVRKNAAEGISDQTLLARIAVHDADSRVRKTAADKVHDCTLLEQIVDHMPREMEKANDDDAQMLTTIAKKLCEAGSQSAALALVKAINAYADNASDYMGHECGPQDYHYEMPRLIELLKKHYKKGTGTTQLKQRDWHIDHGDPKCDTHEDHVISIDFM